MTTNDLYELIYNYMIEDNWSTCAFFKCDGVCLERIIMNEACDLFVEHIENNRYKYSAILCDKQIGEDYIVEFMEELEIKYYQ